MSKQPMFGKNGWLNQGKRACRTSDGYLLPGTSRIKCGNCKREFVTRQKWWNHHFKIW